MRTFTTQMNLFPFTLAAYETPHFTQNPTEFRQAFLENKPEDSWYAYDVEIQSRTCVKFTYYGMRDNFRGGIGAKKGEFTATVPSSLTDKPIADQAYRMAGEKRRLELAAAEHIIIERYANDILDASPE